MESDAGTIVGEIVPIWLNLTTKQHIVDKIRLKPSKLIVPRSINTSENLNICLITADPQRAVKNVVADQSFPTALASKITRIIGYSKLKKRYFSFESRRQLLTEHDLFLADDRIITRLVKALGKVFYQGTTKRPIPIRIAQQEGKDGRRVKQAEPKHSGKEEHSSSVASPAVVAREIESTLSAVPVTLKPGTNVAVRVGDSSFTPQQLSDNIKAVALGIIEKHVVRGWRNVKAIHIKSPNSAAVPIWLADDMWIEDRNVVDDEEQKLIEAPVKTKKRKPQAGTNDEDITKKKPKKSDTAPSGNDQERALAAARKAKLMQLKHKAKAWQDGVISSS